MSPVDVLCPLVMLGVIRKIDSAFVVHADGCRLRLLKAELREEGPQIHCLFGGFGGGYDFGFTG
eukprot:6214789-Pleurochrysis_carterae.AAC.4